MCKSPNKLPNGALVGCRKCKQCAERKILDWSGRCIAESKTTTACHSITLTYGGELDEDGNETDRMDHVRMAVLTYSDVQKYFKRLRKAGFPLTYFVAGEYGSKKGRAHWHVIAFWHGPVPKHVLNKNFAQEHWPHGFSFWKNVNPHSVRYCCKYVQKDLADAEAQSMLRMSKKPPIGARYFARRARHYVASGLAPQDLFYTFPEAVYPDGKKLRFMLAGRSAEMFLEEYITHWRGLPRPWGAHGPVRNTDRPWHYPASELVEEFEDAWQRKDPSWAAHLDEIAIEEKKGMMACQKAVEAKEEMNEHRRKLHEFDQQINSQRHQEYVTLMQSAFLET